MEAKLTNDGERNLETLDPSKPRKKPLMYFCFDLIDKPSENGDESGPKLQTVAVTCPKKELPEETKIEKCCPDGEMLDSSISECVMINHTMRANVTNKWRLPVNGHLYSEDMLTISGNLHNGTVRDYVSLVAASAMNIIWHAT